MKNTMMMDKWHHLLMLREEWEDLKSPLTAWPSSHPCFPSSLMEDAGAPPLCFPSPELLLQAAAAAPLWDRSPLHACWPPSLCSPWLSTCSSSSPSLTSGSSTPPTNSLLLSLAVSDLVVGLLAMPIEGLRHMETCWLLGRLMCALTPYLSYCLLSASLGNMVLISIDRYLAICDPLLYSSKITLNRVKVLICLCWACSLLYNGLILMGHLAWPDRYSSCHGECVVVISFISGIVDLFVTFAGPCTLMVVLYIRVFVVAISQVRLIQSQAAATNARSGVTARISERKAARTLGILIAVFLLCFCPVLLSLSRGSGHLQ